MDKVARARELFLKGYNCAQAVSVAFCEEIGMDEKTVAKAVCGFGGGMGRMRQVCGAVSGAVFVLGNIEGYSDPKDTAGKRDIYKKVQEFAAKFTDICGSIICAQLLESAASDKSPEPSERTEEYYKKRKGCIGCVETAAKLLEEEFSKK